MRYLSGVEISVTWASRTVHIVGLNVDPANPVLVDGLYRTRHGRAARAVAIGEQLATLGIPGAYDGALKYVSNPDLISRTHFARFLVENGHATSTSDVFDRLLGDGKPGFVRTAGRTLPDAVAWIRAAGGEAVVAHPGRYRYTPVEFDAFFGEFIDLGGRAIDVTGSHTPDQYREYGTSHAASASASRGSDFHAQARAVSARQPAAVAARPDSGLGTLALTPGGGLPPALLPAARIRFLPFTPHVPVLQDSPG